MSVSTPLELEGIVAADAHTAALITRYAEAKRVEDEAAKRVKVLRASLLTEFDVHGAVKFTDALDEVLIARTEVQGAERVDLPRLKSRHPEAYSDTVSAGTKFYRLNLPRLSR